MCRSFGFAHAWGFRLGCEARVLSLFLVGADAITSPKGLSTKGRRNPPVFHFLKLSWTRPSRGPPPILAEFLMFCCTHSRGTIIVRSIHKVPLFQLFCVSVVNRGRGDRLFPSKDGGIRQTPYRYAIYFVVQRCIHAGHRVDLLQRQLLSSRLSIQSKQSTCTSVDLPK